MSERLQSILDGIYNTMDGSQALSDYMDRHGVASAGILTIFDDRFAASVAEHLGPRLAGKTVVEIGGGIGLLAMHLGRVAERVYCIEANPLWAGAFADVFLEKKPCNVSYLFGGADEFLGSIRGDVAIFCTHSDVTGMALSAAQFAPVVIDVYGEMIRQNPEHFDKTARTLRALS